MGIFSMLIMGLLLSRSNAKAKYNMEKRVKNINYKKVIKVWVFLQILILLTFKKDTTLDYIIIILTPIILLCLILINAFFLIKKEKNSIKLNLKFIKKPLLEIKKLMKLLISQDYQHFESQMVLLYHHPLHQFHLNSHQLLIKSPFFYLYNS